MKSVGIIHAYPNISIITPLSNYKVILFVPLHFDKAIKEQMLCLPNVEIYEIVFEESESTITFIEGISKRLKIYSFLPLYEGGIILSALVSQRLNLGFYSLPSVMASRNKYFLKLALEYANISIPKSIPVFEYTPYGSLIEKLGSKIILKIVDSMNSQSVTVVKTESEYERSLKDIFDYISTDNKSTEVDRNRFCYGKDEIKVIAQEFCNGKEVNLDIIAVKGEYYPLGIFEKASTNGPFFPETMSLYPSSLTETEKMDIIDLAKKAIRAIGVVSGVAHVEIRFNNNKPMVLDVGLRPGGAYTVKAINSLYGLNLINVISNVMCNDLSSFISPKLKNDTAILYGGIVLSSRGNVNQISGVDILTTLSSVKDYNVLVKEGDYVVPPPFSSQPHFCYYYLESSDVTEVTSTHELINKTIEISIGE